MYSFARTSTVGSHVSHEQLFEVLKIHARDLVGIIPEIAKSEVVEELDPTEGNVFVRKFTFSNGHSVKEKVTIVPPSLILVEFLDNIPGGIELAISEDNEGKLYLTITFRISDKTDEGRARIAIAKETGPKALFATIEKAEKFAKEGRI